MSEVSDKINELHAANAFTRQSGKFDDLYGGNTIVQYKRDRVRKHVLSHLEPFSSILELNSGTGEDAVFFANLGHKVHATDISAGMQGVLAGKIERNNLKEKISMEQCSFTSLNCLKNKGPYDLIFSNFAGLNCTRELDVVLNTLAPLSRTGGLVTLVILPGFCLWEMMMVFKGKFRTAFRRFFRANGPNAHLEGQFFSCWYYNPSFVIRQMKNDFEMIDIEGLCTLVPPSYIDGFAEKYPRLYRFLQIKEDKLKKRWPWRLVGDYYIITFRRK